MARHKLSYAGERFTAACHLQLTPAQREELAAAAKNQGARLSDYVREQLFRRGGQTGVTAGVRRNPEAKAMLDELRRIGNNLTSSRTRPTPSACSGRSRPSGKRSRS